MMMTMMEAGKGGGDCNGGGKVGHEEDMGDGMQCSDHPYTKNSGGICALCLQEKLGKLVSSTSSSSINPLPIRPSSSSSSSPSFRSDSVNVVSAASGGGIISSSSSSSLSLSIRPNMSSKSVNDCQYHEHCTTRRARIPFLLTKKKKKIMVSSTSTSSDSAGIVFKRSKSTTNPRRGQFLDHPDHAVVDSDFSPKRRSGFWSFLSLSSSKSLSSKKIDKGVRESNSSGSKIASMATTVASAASSATSTSSSLANQKDNSKYLQGTYLGKNGAIIEEEEEDESPHSQATGSASSFERKVSRSRSVGCGSRSFSGDFFERISTGFGDCTLRRVESQREGKPKVSAAEVRRSSAGDHQYMKERVKCGGIFSGFMMTSSSSSSSSSSQWVPSSAEDINGKPMGSGGVPVINGRSRSWGWAFASPMRAFSKQYSSKEGKRIIINQASVKNTINTASTTANTTTPDLSAIPSLLSVR